MRSPPRENTFRFGCRQRYRDALCFRMNGAFPQGFQPVVAASLVIKSGIGPLVRLFNEASGQHSF
jgi:hypothetical protein